MKQIIPFALLGALLAVGAVNAASTTPVGYVTQTFKANQYNVFGLTLHSPVAVAGSIDTVAGTTLTDTGAAFGTNLTAGKTYILEITSGAASSIIQEITTWSGDTITTPQDLSASVTAGTTYTLRPAKTIAEVFGAANEAGLLPGGATTADLLWVPDGSGFQKYYYTNAAPPFVTAGWKNTGTGNADKGGAPLVYVDGMILQRRGGTDVQLTVVGEVKVSDTTYLVDQPYTYLGGVYPAASTLATSSLQTSLKHGSVTTADVIWMPTATGSFLKYYYADAAPPFVTAGWKRSDTGNTDQGAAEITSGFFVEKRTVGSFNAKITAPVIAP
jgi:hypothetical protein